MALTSLEIIVTILALVTIIKLLVIVINKRSWFDLTNKTLGGNKGITSVILIILGAIVFYYLIQEVSIVQIMGVVAFVGILFGLGIVQYNKEVLSIAKKVYAKKFSAGIWVYSLIWLALMLWALYEIFVV